METKNKKMVKHNLKKEAPNNREEAPAEVFYRSRHVNFRNIFWASAVIIGALSFCIFKIANHYPSKIDLSHRSDFFGVTFSTKFCDQLGLDWRETYSAILDDLKVKNIRIPVYWDEIEKKEGVYDFAKYDYLVGEGSKHDAKFIINVGRRIPRWPECHSPAWLVGKDKTSAQDATLKTLRTIVERYRDSSNVEYWQVENEPFLSSFGVCPELDPDFLQAEVDLVRSLDGRPIIITGSGELGSWNRQAKIGDIFGSTLYRVVYSPWFGFIKYPLPTSFYKLKARLAGLSPDRLMVLELQAEPWIAQGKMMYERPAEINKTMSVGQFKANLQYAINLNFRRTYIWGVEWWYFQKKYGNPEYWQIAAGLFN